MKKKFSSLVVVFLLLLVTISSVCFADSKSPSSTTDLYADYISTYSSLKEKAEQYESNLYLSLVGEPWQYPNDMNKTQGDYLLPDEAIGKYSIDCVAIKYGLNYNSTVEKLNKYNEIKSSVDYDYDLLCTYNLSKQEQCLVSDVTFKYFYDTSNNELIQYISIKNNYDNSLSYGYCIWNEKGVVLIGSK